MRDIRENDIRPAKMMADKQAFVDADHEFLLSGRDAWVEVACPACSNRHSDFYGEKHGFVYVHCGQCGTVYTNPRPSQELLHDFYTSSQNYQYWNRHIFPATEAVRRERIFRPRAKRVLEYCSKLQVTCHTLVEVGAGFGTFCEEIKKLKAFKNVIALEPACDLAETCRSRGLEVINLPVEKTNKHMFADVVAAFEVIEHVFSPRDFVTRCAKLLKPQGILVLSCPNVLGFDVATLKMISCTFNHEHLNYFNIRSLPLLIEQCGLEVLDVQTPGKLDAELVRKHILGGEIELTEQPFLVEMLKERWEEVGEAFQKFISNHKLSSHMWLIARKTK